MTVRTHTIVSSIISILLFFIRRDLIARFNFSYQNQKKKCITILGYHFSRFPCSIIAERNSRNTWSSRELANDWMSAKNILQIVCFFFWCCGPIFLLFFLSWISMLIIIETISNPVERWKFKESFLRHVLSMYILSMRNRFINSSLMSHDLIFIYKDKSCVDSLNVLLGLPKLAIK